ncbi:MAG: hypothetical protein WBC44_11760 [Planctomycetaceae bacterium]
MFRTQERSSFMPFFRQHSRRERTATAYRDRVRLALQTALIGQITAAIRLISVELGAATIRVVVYFHLSLSDDDQSDLSDEVASCLGLELGDPPAGPAAECHFLRCDEPQRVPVRGEVVFARKGVLTC